MNEAQETARSLRSYKKRIADTYRVSKQVIERSRLILDKLQDHYLLRLVDVTELRLENYFRKELKVSYGISFPDKKPAKRQLCTRSNAPSRYLRK
jgi:hypothetical protein